MVVAQNQSRKKMQKELQKAPKKVRKENNEALYKKY